MTQTDLSALSSLRKQGSSDIAGEWIPAPRLESRTSFAGMTNYVMLLLDNDLTWRPFQEQSV